jgi:hypothetical protein
MEVNEVNASLGTDAGFEAVETELVMVVSPKSARHARWLLLMRMFAFTTSEWK